MSPAAAPLVARAAIDSAVARRFQSFPQSDQRTGRQPRRRIARRPEALKIP